MRAAEERERRNLSHATAHASPREGPPRHRAAAAYPMPADSPRRTHPPPTGTHTPPGAARPTAQGALGDEGPFALRTLAGPCTRCPAAAHTSSRRAGTARGRSRSAGVSRHRPRTLCPLRCSSSAAFCGHGPRARARPRRRGTGTAHRGAHRGAPANAAVLAAARSSCRRPTPRALPLPRHGRAWSQTALLGQQRNFVLRAFRWVFVAEEWPSEVAMAVL